jgi:transglutaminase-like putative cysteine protease
MVRLQFSIRLGYAVFSDPTDFIFNIHAMRTARQRVVAESLMLSQAQAVSFQTEPFEGNRLVRLQAQPGRLELNYLAVVDIEHRVDDAAVPEEVPVCAVPARVLPYLYPSRYCESDKLQALAVQTFGHIAPGYARVEAIRNWVHQRTRFQSGSSTHTTSALDTLHQRAGVCRDFAHLMIALCRGLNIPARFTAGLDYGADPALGPTDFHAYVEVFLSGRWYMFDPSGTAIPMGFVRIGSGRDAADVAFATILGAIRSDVPVLTIQALRHAQRPWALPRHCDEALCTDDPGESAIHF